MTLHLVSSIRLLSSASSFDSSQHSVTYFRGAKRDLRQRGPNGTGRSCHEKAVLNNLSGIKKSHSGISGVITDSSSFLPVFLKPVSSLVRDWLVKVGLIAVALQNVKVKTVGRESERLLLLSQPVVMIME